MGQPPSQSRRSRSDLCWRALVGDTDRAREASALGALLAKLPCLVSFEINDTLLPSPLLPLPVAVFKLIRMGPDHAEALVVSLVRQSRPREAAWAQQTALTTGCECLRSPWQSLAPTPKMRGLLQRITATASPSFRRSVLASETQPSLQRLDPRFMWRSVTRS